MKNNEGYQDDTAGKAIRNYNRMPHNIKNAFNALNNLANLVGLEVVELRDTKTGRCWKGR